MYQRALYNNVEDDASGKELCCTRTAHKMRVLMIVECQNDHNVVCSYETYPEGPLIF